MAHILSRLSLGSGHNSEYATTNQCPRGNEGWQPMWYLVIYAVKAHFIVFIWFHGRVVIDRQWPPFMEGAVNADTLGPVPCLAIRE